MSAPLYHRIEAVTGMPGLNADVAEAALGWMEDRLTQDDVLDALRDVFPDAPEEQLLAAVTEVSITIRRP